MKNNSTLGNWSARRAYLLQALQQGTPELDESIISQLDAYIAAQLTNQNYLNLYPEIAILLDSSPQITAAYARLFELAEAEAAATLPEPAAIPAADLSFLSTSRPTAESVGRDRLEMLRAHLALLDNRIRLRLSQELLDTFRPTNRPASALRSAPNPSERYGELLFKVDAADMPEEILEVVVYSDNQQPNFCLIEVIAIPPGKSWPELGNIHILLTFGRQTATADTDVWGVASFEGIPTSWLSTLTIEVTY